MGEFAGAGSYEVLTSSMQRDRLFTVDLDSGLGRKPTAVPSHLSRVLYVPKHSMLSLSIYDAGERYRKAVDYSPFGGEQVTGKALMGSRLFKTRLNTMTSTGQGQKEEVEYVVDLDIEKIRDGGDISATVLRGDQTDTTPHINMYLSLLPNGLTVLFTN